MTAAKYHGGELRKERSSDLTTVAVAVEAAGLDKEKDALAYAVLQRALGSGPRVKWGNSVSPLQRDATSAASAEQFAITAFNAAYSDSGLFGFVLSSQPNVAGSVSFSKENELEIIFIKNSYQYIKSNFIGDKSCCCISKITEAFRR